ncbi:LysR family transcriptional regulator [Photobacterium sanctipauli]|uniref:LysR family transcriptional regulator n=1 Tax=Photobacterium sanctipauli TaxID=1342794 RepID=A0A2T3NWN3_9GAMM|nr:LysR substrate-binding domain-containing protein [Photobacterium sanctipauli]PSW20661.1 LysR family transcriptional regulator [Photobacterium sanctipauli]
MNSHFQHSRITLKMLQYFYAVAQEQHFGRAAEKLNITKPPLSAQIKELESILGTELFIRNTRNVELTSVGRILKGECELMFDFYENSINKVIKASRKEKKTINIGLISSFFWAGLGKALKKYRDKNPNYTLNFLELTPERQKQSLIDKSIDLGLARFADTINIAPFQADKVLDDNMCLVVSSEHPLCDRKSIGISELSAEEFVLMHRHDSASTGLIINSFLVEEMNMNVTKEVFEPNTLMAVVATSNMVSIVPSSFRMHQWDDVTFINLKEQIPAHMCAMYASEDLDEVLMELLAFLKAELASYRRY